MTIPAWILDVFAAVMLLVAAVSAVRLGVARPWRRADPDADIDGSHLLMGIAMAGTLAAALSTLPYGAWEVIFGLLTAWFAYRVVRETRGRGASILASGHHTPHLVHSAAMLYMFLALTTAKAASGGSGMGGMAASSGSAMPTLRLPTVALVFAFVLAGFVVSDLDRLSAPAAGRSYRRARDSFAPAGVALAGAVTMAGPPSSASGLARSASSAAYDLPAASAASGGTATSAASGDMAGGAEAAAATEAPPPSADAASSGRSHGGASRLVLAPGVARGCRIAMGVTMAFMLIIMI